MLAVVACALAGAAALADDLADDVADGDANDRDSNIVLASATPYIDDSRNAAGQKDDPAVAEALAGVAASNKLELEMRLSGHKSALLAADL